MTQHTFASGRTPTRRHLLIAAGAGAVTAALAPAGVIAATERSLYRWRGTALGGAASMLLDAGGERRGEALAAACLDEIRRLENVFSLYRADSALSRLNAAQRLKAPPQELLDLLALSRQLWKDSEGAFDPTVQPLWHAYADQAGEQTLARARASLGFDKLRLSPDEIAFTRPGMALTLNGIAQGYITDRVAALLRRQGLDHTLIQLGETRALGRQPDESPWQVEVAAPDRPGRADERIALDNTALAVSSGRALPFAAGGTHILDPRTGKSPSDSRTVAVRAPQAALADGLSTALSVLAPETAPALLNRYPASAGYALAKDGSLTAIAG